MYRRVATGGAGVGVGAGVAVGAALALGVGVVIGAGVGVGSDPVWGTGLVPVTRTDVDSAIQ